EGGHLRAAVASVHAGAAFGDPDRGAGPAREAKADRARGRRAEPGESAVRVQVSHALLEGSADLRGGGPCPDQPRPGAPERVPLRGGREAAADRERTARETRRQVTGPWGGGCYRSPSSF